MTATKMTVVALATAFAFAAVSVAADETKTSYNLLPGTCTKPIAIPVNNAPVLMMGNSITANDRESAMVTITRANANQPTPLLSWAGTDFSVGTERGFAAGPGTIIMNLDSVPYISVQTAASTHIQVCNSSSNPGNGVGYLTFIY